MANIKKVLSSKTTVCIVAVIAILFILLMLYSSISILINVKKMSKTSEVAAFFPTYPSLENTKGKELTLIKKGEYLVKMGDCLACHTNTLKKDAKPFAGGLPMETPFGTLYSPNITPDKETGIGNWTEEQFIRAMKDGISPEGHYYYPAFPYFYFNKMTLEDIKAIKAYLDSVPSVKQKNLPHEMVWPLNFRFLQLGWRVLFFNPHEEQGPFKYNPEQTPEWNRGAYLVEGLGHCAMCHTPSYHIFSEELSLGAPIKKYHLTGAKIQGWLAPNISESNLGKVDIAEIVQVFTHDRLIGGGQVKGPMLEANHDSLRYITDEDLRSIATYIKSVRSELPPKPKSKGGIGEATYDSYCSGCHAMGAGGAPKLGDSTTWNPLLKVGIDRVYTNAIKGIGDMPAKGTCLSCSDEEIKRAVDYMVAALSGGTKVTLSIPKPKELSVSDGKHIYEANCSACHAKGLNKAPIPGDMPAWKHIIDAGFLKTFRDITSGKAGHPPRAACPNCTDAEIKAALKYMMNESTSEKDFSLW